MNKLITWFVGFFIGICVMGIVGLPLAKTNAVLEYIQHPEHFELQVKYKKTIGSTGTEVEIPIDSTIIYK